VPTDKKHPAGSNDAVAAADVPGNLRDDLAPDVGGDVSGDESDQLVDEARQSANDEVDPFVSDEAERSVSDEAERSSSDELARSLTGEPDADTADTAAASALARAREAARAKGFRPGVRPMRKRRPLGQQGYSSADSGRDPSLLGDQMDRLLVDRGWKVDVAVGAVMGRWETIVGTDVAAHCTPLTFGDGVLTVRADSTAWATQLRLISSTILARLEAEVGKDTVVELRVQGPGAPSWSRGLRKSTGPGPRDTYG
jgi:predicted nucleic acid-binding Zn ribbon protein